MVKKLLLLFLCIDVVVLSAVYIREFCAFMFPSSGNASQIELQGGPTTIELSHRSFTIFEFPAMTTSPKALILFASGDGGWQPWEESVCRDFQAHGYAVMGIDSVDYARTDYDLETLQADYTKIAQLGLDAYKSSPPPVIVGGWSMGAVQAVAVGGGPNRPPGLVGLLLISPGSRGRYGLNGADRLDVPPTGPGTFGVADFISGLDGLRIIQWHSGGDPYDSTTWLPNLAAPHRENDFINSGHDYAYANPAFLTALVDSIDWILTPSSP